MKERKPRIALIEVYSLLVVLLFVAQRRQTLILICKR